MSKKWTVVRDELGVRGPGLYAIYPFERLNRYNKGLFKVGMSLKLDERIDGDYHRDFPFGVYLLEFLQEPAGTRMSSRTTATGKGEVRKKLLKYEKELFDLIIDKGGERIYSTTRVTKQNKQGLGATEWVYASPKMIHDSFVEIHTAYGGVPQSYPLIRQVLQENAKKNSKGAFHGEIYFKVKKKT